MQDIQSYLNSLKHQCRKKCKTDRNATILLSLFASVFFPLYETFYFGWLRGAVASVKILPWILLGLTCLVGVVHIAIAICLFFVRGREELLNFVELQFCFEKNLELDKEKERMQLSYSSLLSYNDISRKIIDHRELVLKEIELGRDFDFSILNQVLDRFEVALPEIFQFERGMYYNFSIYLFNPQTRLLECKYTSRDHVSKKAKRGASRSWGAGQGHIGKCFSNCVAYIDPDITKDPMFSKVNNNADDVKYYRSAISIPLKALYRYEDGCRKIPYGVMLLTCSVPNKLSKVDFEIMLNLQSLLEEFIHKLKEDDGNE